MLLLSHFSRVRLFATPWTAAYQAPPSVGFSRQEYCSGVPFPSPRDLPNPGIEPRSPAWQAGALPSEPPEKIHSLLSPISSHFPCGSLCLKYRRPEFSPWVGKISWRRKWQPTRVFLPGKFHGQWSLVSCSPWGLQRVGHD